MTKILLLTRHYPPAVSGGAKRPYLLAQALRSAGAEVRVCAPSLPEGEPGWAIPHPNRDPPTTPGPARLSWRALARDLLLWPDPDIRWSIRAAKAALSDHWRPDWVISTSPPESIHVAGEWIARQTHARWAADLRDLWLEAPHRHERLRLHRRVGEKLLARRLLPKASLVTAVDPVVAAEATRLGARNTRVLPHFIPNARPAPAELPGDRLNIVHAGSIALSDPDARISDLLRPFEVAWARNPQLQLHLVGRLTDTEQASAKNSPAASAIQIWGVLPLDGALAMMAAADALIFVASGKMHVPPSKIVDYMMFETPIIATGDGPWREDPRCPKGDPAEVMAQLRGHSKRPTTTSPATASEAAALLLDWMAPSEGS